MALKSGGYLSALERTAIGSYHVKMLTLKNLRNIEQMNLLIFGTKCKLIGITY